ncbi:hypothetical protein C0Q70_00350 [Pomacea canaliculata]|uniref:Metalloendopeptidase n=1 Tax=Pomacea canaliculata TaxID=400727 RepID=A0A2T7PWF3_POMCA|nr:hypothetical protein C0Q70_00350 [Pomacea canaliculata]
MDPVVFLLRMRAPCWWQPGVVAHELGHVIGFFHQQSRPDRDEYIRIHYENIANHLKDSFTKLSWDRIADLGVPYDYLSIMHYGSRAFSYNGRITIETRDRSYQNLIGNRVGLSFRDIKSTNLLYNCRPISCHLRDDDCPGEGFVSKDCSCWCPSYSSDRRNPYVVCTPGGEDGDKNIDRHGIAGTSDIPDIVRGTHHYTLWRFHKSELGQLLRSPLRSGRVLRLARTIPELSPLHSRRRLVRQHEVCGGELLPVSADMQELWDTLPDILTFMQRVLVLQSHALDSVFQMEIRQLDCFFVLQKYNGTDITLKVAAGILAGIVFVAVVVFCTMRVRRRREDNLPLQTATACRRRRGLRALWNKLLRSMRWPRRPPQSPVTCMNDVGYTVVAPPPDVQNQSGDDCLQSSNRLVIPNGGIAHDAEDTKDFILSSVP